jgi:hypothetical protein
MTKMKLSIVPLLLLLAACSTNPFKTAQTVEQKSDALYGSYVIAKEQGVTILQNESIPDEAKRPLAQVMVDSKALADELQNSLIHYSTVKAQIAQGSTSQERLAIVERELNGWIVKATPVINKLIETVGGLLK